MAHVGMESVQMTGVGQFFQRYAANTFPGRAWHNKRIHDLALPNPVNIRLPRSSPPSTTKILSTLYAHLPQDFSEFPVLEISTTILQKEAGSRWIWETLINIPHAYCFLMRTCPEIAPQAPRLPRIPHISPPNECFSGMVHTPFLIAIANDDQHRWHDDLQYHIPKPLESRLIRTRRESSHRLSVSLKRLHGH
ncbi:unnamed protein product [Cyclocybe aegerita]|uniref:Uncharacterized protein n=1 Tax=Cyclocybe aegerita TaxID=1973307 RepID=A0A8S0X1M8_CYCAE|nr:unnamed protein product [Cyclocybe aegerita]